MRPDLGGGGVVHRGGICKELPEASSICGRANARRLQDGLTAGKGWVNQKEW